MEYLQEYPAFLSLYKNLFEDWIIAIITFDDEKIHICAVQYEFFWN